MGNIPLEGPRISPLKSTFGGSKAFPWEMHLWRVGGFSLGNPPLEGPRLSPGKSTRKTVTTMASNDLVVGEDHMLGLSCQRYNWQTGRRGSIALGTSPRREKF